MAGNERDVNERPSNLFLFSIFFVNRRRLIRKRPFLCPLSCLHVYVYAECLRYLSLWMVARLAAGWLYLFLSLSFEMSLAPALPDLIMRAALYASASAMSLICARIYYWPLGYSGRKSTVERQTRRAGPDDEATRAIAQRNCTHDYFILFNLMYRAQSRHQMQRQTRQRQHGHGHDTIQLIQIKSNMHWFY